MKADLKMINSAPCIGPISVSHWEDCWDETGWTTACQACATCCPEPDWLMGRIIHLMALSWHSSLLSSLFSPGTSRSAGCWLSLYLQTHTQSQNLNSNKDTWFFSHKVLEEKLYRPSQLPVGFPRPHTLLHSDLRYPHILRCCLYPLRLTSTTLSALDPVKLILFKGWLHITFCLRNVSLTVNQKWQLD